MLDPKEAFIVLNSLQNDLSFAQFTQLLKTFGSPEKILSQNVETLKQVPGIKLKAALLIAHWNEVFDLKQELALIEKFGVHILTNECPDYPTSLSQIYDPPLVLYTLGSITQQDEKALGIVGSRKATDDGKKNTFQLSEKCASRGWTIVSGLASGIDTEAHEGALKARGRTLAVLGHGLATPLYPSENESLAQDIVQNGALISEFPMTFAPLPRNFPRRNRILAGLSQALLVAEASLRSGALITADLALEQGKPVLALPGPINSVASVGSNTLIQQGAKLVLKVEDIIEELAGIPSSEKSPPKCEDPDEATLLQCLFNEEKQLDRLLEETQLPAAQLNMALFSLEIKNLVKQLPGQYYVKTLQN